MIMEWVIVVLIVILILCFIGNISSEDYDSKIFSCLCVIIISAILTITLIDYNSKDEITPLDVYRGKTTLEITYRDSIPIDTIVVFKDEFKK